MNPSGLFFFFFLTIYPLHGGFVVQTQQTLYSWLGDKIKSVFSTSLTTVLDSFYLLEVIGPHLIKCATFQVLVTEKWVVCSSKKNEWFVFAAETQKTQRGLENI